MSSERLMSGFCRERDDELEAAVAVLVARARRQIHAVQREEAVLGRTPGRRRVIAPQHDVPSADGANREPVVDDDLQVQIRPGRGHIGRTLARACRQAKGEEQAGKAVAAAFSLPMRDTPKRTKR